MLPTKNHSQNWLPSVFNDFFGNEWITKASRSAPAMNIKELPNEYKVEIAAPGLTKDDFTIAINNDNQLVVSVNKGEDEVKESENGKYLRREFAYTQFCQTMLLPDNIDKDNIEAKVTNGVLNIDIPKCPEEKKESKKIDVK